MPNKLDETQKYFITQLAIHFNKQSFSIEEAKNFMINDIRFSEKDFSECWQYCYTINDNKTYISRLNNTNKYILRYRALKYIPLPKQKDPWTHSELIALFNGFIAIIFGILGVIF